MAPVAKASTSSRTSSRRRQGGERSLTFDGAAFPLDSGVKFPASIAHNVIPIAGAIVEDGARETNEEKKFRDESRKILEIPDCSST